MNEKTYVRSTDQCEVMVQCDDNDNATYVYAWHDNIPNIPGVTWKPCTNPIFQYADNPQLAAEYVREHFNA